MQQPHDEYRDAIVRRGPCSTARSRSTPTTPTLWLEARLPIFSIIFMVGATRGPTTRTKCWGKPIARSSSTPTMSGHTSQRPSISACRARPSEALGAADAGLAVNPNYVLLYMPRADRRKFARPLRAGEGRCGAGDAAEPARPRYRHSSTSIVGDAEISLGHFDAAIDEYRKALDLGFQIVFRLHEPGGGLRPCGQDGRGEGRPHRSAPPQSRDHGQMDEGAHAQTSEPCIDGLRKAGLPEE